MSGGLFYSYSAELSAELAGKDEETREVAADAVCFACLTVQRCVFDNVFLHAVQHGFNAAAAVLHIADVAHAGDNEDIGKLAGVEAGQQLRLVHAVLLHPGVNFIAADKGDAVVLEVICRLFIKPAPVVEGLVGKVDAFGAAEGLYLEVVIRPSGAGGFDDAQLVFFQKIPAIDSRPDAGVHL